ncbi:MAG: YggT family protein, partial [Xanthomonadaceae bacterium]|nr:YggT family protein [Xanthomonadaceae bacterium]
MTYLLQALSVILQLAFSLVATLFVLRLLAEASRVDFRNPLSQFLYKATNPVLAPVRRVIPNWRRINLAAILVAWLAMVIEQAALFALHGDALHPAGLLLLGAANLINFVLLFYLVLVFGWSLLSMLQVDPYQPLVRVAGAIVDPLLRPLRGKLTAGMLDFS